MKCISICQPWAWAVIYAAKNLENRPWRTSYRGPLLIHASQSRKWLDDLMFDADLLLGLSPEKLVFGAIIGHVRVTGCHRPEACPDNPWARGPWCHEYRDAQPIDPPIPWRGQLGIFDVPDSWRITDALSRQAGQESLRRDALAEKTAGCSQSS